VDRICFRTPLQQVPFCRYFSSTELFHFVDIFLTIKTSIASYINSDVWGNFSTFISFISYGMIIYVDGINYFWKYSYRLQIVDGFSYTKSKHDIDYL
jgi:hypothetical protein